jgi:hypothetical protein
MPLFKTGCGTAAVPLSLWTSGWADTVSAVCPYTGLRRNITAVKARAASARLKNLKG